MTDSQHRENVTARLNADADLAAAELDEQYRARLCRLVEREMNRRFRRKEDPEDVVQSAFRTFFRRNAQGEFHIDSAADLWRLLETITRRKILKHVEKLGAGKRDPKREEYAEGDDLRGRDPTPEEAAIAADLMEKAAGRPGRELRAGSPSAAAKLHRGEKSPPRWAVPVPSFAPGWTAFASDSRDCRTTTRAARGTGRRAASIAWQRPRASTCGTSAQSAGVRGRFAFGVCRRGHDARRIVPVCRPAAGALDRREAAGSTPDEAGSGRPKIDIRSVRRSRSTNSFTSPASPLPWSATANRFQSPARKCCGSLGSGWRRNHMRTSGCGGCLRPRREGLPTKAATWSDVGS